tara:strand:- start:388 stop:675 length:288 start_codon:yes stop_codon:yes gene_type:complete
MSVSNEQLLEEEKLACDTPLSSRIHRVKLPATNEKEVELEAQSCYLKYNNLFQAYEDAEYFSMLPLTQTTRQAVLERAIVLEEEARHQKAKWMAS